MHNFSTYYWSEVLGNFQAQSGSACWLCKISYMVATVYLSTFLCSILSLLAIFRKLFLCLLSMFWSSLSIYFRKYHLVCVVTQRSSPQRTARLRTSFGFRLLLSDAARVAFCLTLKVGTHEGTSPCNKSRGQVPSCELAIFATKSSRRDQIFWSLLLVPRIQTGLNLWD